MTLQHVGSDLLKTENSFSWFPSNFLSTLITREMQVPYTDFPFNIITQKAELS